MVSILALSRTFDRKKTFGSIPALVIELTGSGIISGVLTGGTIAVRSNIPHSRNAISPSGAERVAGPAGILRMGIGLGVFAALIEGAIIAFHRFRARKQVGVHDTLLSGNVANAINSEIRWIGISLLSESVPSTLSS
jgi:hypothetical protein